MSVREKRERAASIGGAGVVTVTVNVRGWAGGDGRAAPGRNALGGSNGGSSVEWA